MIRSQLESWSRRRQWLESLGLLHRAESVGSVTQPSPESYIKAKTTLLGPQLSLSQVRLGYAVYDWGCDMVEDLIPAFID
jgi:hypothetical protein